jgi:hypothetical protein
MLVKYVFFSFMFLLVWSCSENNGPVSSMEQLKERVDKINDLSKQVDQKRNDLFTTIREFNNGRSQQEQYDIANIDTMLGKPEQEILRTMFKNEQDVSYKGLLKNILARNEEITALNDQISDLQKQLPMPYLVKQGDTHYEIVMDYLMTNKGLPKQQAEKIATQTAMVDDILPGNQVWLLFHEGHIGTYVTQGTAYLSPLRYQLLAKKRLIEKSKMLGSREISTSPSEQKN